MQRAVYVLALQLIDRTTVACAGEDVITTYRLNSKRCWFWLYITYTYKRAGVNRQQIKHVTFLPVRSIVKQYQICVSYVVPRLLRAPG